MSTPEQRARDLLTQMGMMLDGSDGPRAADTMSAGEVVALANLYAELDGLRELLGEAYDCIPLYADGRYDELFDRIEAATDDGIKNEPWPYASIPLVMQHELRTKHGIDVDNRNHWPRLFDIINKHYPYLKTTNKEAAADA